MVKPKPGYELVKPGIYKKVVKPKDGQENTANKYLREAYEQIEKKNPSRGFFEDREPPNFRKSTIIKSMKTLEKMTSSTPYNVKDIPFFKYSPAISPISSTSVRNGHVKSLLKTKGYKNNNTFFKPNEEQNISACKIQNLDEGNKLNQINSGRTRKKTGSDKTSIREAERTSKEIDNKDGRNKSSDSSNISEIIVLSSLSDSAFKERNELSQLNDVNCIQPDKDKTEVIKRTILKNTSSDIPCKRNLLEEVPEPHGGNEIRTDNLTRNENVKLNLTNIRKSGYSHLKQKEIQLADKSKAGTTHTCDVALSPFPVLNHSQNTRIIRTVSKNVQTSTNKGFDNSNLLGDGNQNQMGSQDSGHSSSNDSKLINDLYMNNHNIFESLAEDDNLHDINFSEETIGISQVFKPWRFENDGLLGRKSDSTFKLNFIRTNSDIQRNSQVDPDDIPITHIVKYHEGKLNEEKSFSDSDSSNQELMEYFSLKLNNHKKITAKPLLLDCDEKEKMVRKKLLETTIFSQQQIVAEQPERGSDNDNVQGPSKQYSATLKSVTKKPVVQDRTVHKSVARPHLVVLNNELESTTKDTADIEQLDPCAADNMNKSVRKGCQKNSVRNNLFHAPHKLNRETRSSSKESGITSASSEEDVHPNPDVTASKSASREKNTEVTKLYRNKKSNIRTKTKPSSSAKSNLSIQSTTLSHDFCQFNLPESLPVDNMENVKTTSPVKRVKTQKESKKLSKVTVTTTVTDTTTLGGRPRRNCRPVRFKTDIVLLPNELKDTRSSKTTKKTNQQSHNPRKPAEKVPKNVSKLTKNIGKEKSLSCQSRQSETDDIGNEYETVNNCNSQGGADLYVCLEKLDFNTKLTRLERSDNMPTQNEVSNIINNISKTKSRKTTSSEATKKGSRVNKKSKTKNVAKTVTQKILKVVESSLSVTSAHPNNVSDNSLLIQRRKSRSYLLREFLQNNTEDCSLQPTFIIKEPTDFKKIGTLEVNEVFTYPTSSTTVGYLKLQPGKSKPMSISHKHNIHFTVLRGEALVFHNEELGIVSQGQSFSIAIGEQYCIKNNQPTDLTLHFVKMKVAS